MISCDAVSPSPSVADNVKVTSGVASKSNTWLATNVLSPSKRNPESTGTEKVICNDQAEVKYHDIVALLVKDQEW